MRMEKKIANGTNFWQLIQFHGFKMDRCAFFPFFLLLPFVQRGTTLGKGFEGSDQKRLFFFRPPGYPHQ
ncbi:Hypothetical protein Minf_1996 [Methylacidiphilum infernorum V4]|uniref:Uncharacterized protein n=1 Tax=Methylacidiphilum infernorum (isolate V4) TaxID=481448 RepID=B3DYK2_METI4|nr:Hypothetical protein Minf_1996 [Methylacidiphilum infernorum V4]